MIVYGVFLFGLSLVILLARGTIFRAGEKYAPRICGEESRVHYLKRKKSNYNLLIIVVFTLGAVFVIAGLVIGISNQTI